jgi:hypothetical protein
MSCVQSNHSDIPRLCRARGRAPRGVVPPHVAADLGRGATPGAACARSGCGVGVGCGVSAVFTQQSTLRA